VKEMSGMKRDYHSDIILEVYPVASFAAHESKPSLEE
jgi:hypothetical protein